MSSKSTKKLIEIVEKRASDAGSSNNALQQIMDDADITVPVKKGSISMIDCVLAEADRNQQTVPLRAQYCRELAEVLRTQASVLLHKSVFSSGNPNFDQMKKLIKLRASCYQGERFGPLGLLGEILKQDQTPIQLDVVQFLIENDPYVKFGLTRIDDQQQTCLTLSQKNSKCPKEVKDYLRKTFDMVLNRVPLDHPQTDVNEVVAWIRRGANPEAVDEHQNTVLSNAVFTNNLELVRVLVAAGCNTMHANKYKLTPIQMAKNATPRNAKLVAILETQNTNGELKQLIESKKSQLVVNDVTTLLADGANINAPITNNSTFLHLLIANEGTPEMVTAFVNDFNADIAAMDIKGHRPIEACILFDKTPYTVLQAYLKLPKMTTDIYFNTKLNKSILQFAKEEQRSEAAKMIQDALNLRLWNIVTRANQKKDHNLTLIPEIKQLNEYGAQIDHKHIDKEYDQWTVLHLACKSSTKSFIQYLIEQLKINYVTPNGNGDYPIAIAAEYGYLSIVEYLHGLRGTKLNVANKDKQTPLHLATKNHHLRVVRYLVLWGADHQAQNLSTQTPLDIARNTRAKNKTDEITDKTLIHFLQRLTCPETDESVDQKASRLVKPNIELDTCELVRPISVEPVKIIGEDQEEKLSAAHLKNMLLGTPNDNLHSAAKNGAVHEAKNAIGQGADICYRKNNRTPFEVATSYVNEHYKKLTSPLTKPEDRGRYQQMMNGCQQIAEDIRQIARVKLTEAIQQSNASQAVAYIQAGAPITNDILYFICTTCDNVQIIDYVIKQNAEVRQAMINYTTEDSPYRLAKRHKFNQVASYLKYSLTLECTRAINENNTEYVKKLVRAGAGVEMHDTNNLQVAFKHNNAELIQILCDNGAKMPPEWLQSKKITLPKEITQTLDPEIVFRINRSLINRRLRFAAASGDLTTVIQCQFLSADINSENCHGSTALLCAIQHGNYFPIVHALASCGATMLHSNEAELMSLIDLAQKNKYTQIANYLTQELNAQFLTTILNNDQISAQKFEALGADFNCQDEQKRTALHYAVQYHGIELVTWLCERGSAPTKADTNGNYPITEATEKGDYAVVELFVEKYPATKQQKNKTGQTAIQIAQKQGFKRIAYLLEHGTAPGDSIENEAATPGGPKYSPDELSHAAKTGQMKVVSEFREEKYESRDDKRRLCYQLINIAKKAKQQEVIGILQSYYEKELNAEIPSDMESGEVVRLNQRHKEILKGFLTGLSRIVAESPIVLDPADPQTYTKLFADLTSNVQKRSQELSDVTNIQDVAKLSDKDMQNIDQKLANITNELNGLAKERKELVARIQDNEQQLYAQKDLSAIQKKTVYDLREENKKQLATYECSIFLYQRQQESIINRRNTIEFIKGNYNLFIFYRTIENRLEALFHSVLASQGGYLQTAVNGTFGTAAKVVKAIPSPGDVIPFSNIIMGAVKSIFSGVLSKLDEKEQKKEIHNISTLGNVEELERIASDTAGLVTLYYREQIELIDISSKIKGSNVFNDKIKWIKDVFIDVRPEGNEEMTIVIVADYIITWMIDALKAGKSQVIPTEPIPQQLWLCVAKKNPTESTKISAATDATGLTAGRIQIPVKVKQKSGKEVTQPVQLRYLIGCVSVVGSNGEIYRYRVAKDSQDRELEDLELFGYVYATPFSNSDQTIVSIVEGRNLSLVKHDKSGEILTRFKDIIEPAQVYQSQGNELASKSAMTIETAEQVAQVLREKKYFLNANDVRDQLEKSGTDIKYSIDVLRDDIQGKVTYYQTSIDATREQLKLDLQQSQESLRKHNEECYQNTMKKLNEQFQSIEKRLEQKIGQRLDQIEEDTKKKLSEMQTIVDSNQTLANKALQQSTEANQASRQSAQQAAQASEYAKQLAESIEQRRQEFEKTTERCQNDVRKTVTELKSLFEKSISDIRGKMEQDLQRTKQSAEQSAIDSKESSRSAKESTSATRDIQKQMKEQFDMNRKETEKIMAEVKDIKKHSERLAVDAKEASRQAKQAADASSTALEKVNKKVDNISNDNTKNFSK